MTATLTAYQVWIRSWALLVKRAPCTLSKLSHSVVTRSRGPLLYACPGFIDVRDLTIQFDYVDREHHTHVIIDHTSSTCVSWYLNFLQAYQFQMM